MLSDCIASHLSSSPLPSPPVKGVTHETCFPHERSGSEERPILWGAKAYSGALKMLNTMLCDQCHRSNQGLFLPPLVGHEPGGPRGSEQIVRSTTCFHPTKFPDLFIPPSYVLSLGPFPDHQENRSIL